MLSSIVSGRCTNYDCLSSDILDLREGDIYYSLKVEISDHTGTLSNCKLSADAAAKMLQCKVCWSKLLVRLCKSHSEPAFALSSLSF